MPSADVPKVWKGRQPKEINRKRRLLPITMYHIKKVGRRGGRKKI